MTKPIKFVYLTLSVIFIGYIIVRAFLLDITYDEAWTIDCFVELPIIDIINYSPPIANNHMINTLLIKVFYYFGSESVFLARLPNVIAAVFYFHFAYKISKEFFSSILGLMLFILLVSNPFLLDFFSLARGYGLSLSSIIGSIYFLLVYFQEHKVKSAILSLILISISILNSFSVLFFLPGLLFIIYYSLYFNKSPKAHFIYLVKGTVIIIFLLTAFIYEPLRKLITTGNLWYGGNKNFYDDTLYSLVSSTLGGQFTPNVIYLILNSFLIFFFLILLLSFLNGNNLDYFWSSKKLKIIILIVAPVILTISAHYLFGTKYLIDRTAIFLYPLIIIGIIQFADDIYTIIYRRFAETLIVAFTIFTLANMSYSLNFYTTTIWFQDAHTCKVLKTINEIGKNQKKSINLDADWPFRSSILYYQKRNSYPNVHFVEEEPSNLDSSIADYYLHLVKPIENAGYYPDNSIKNYNRDTILYFEKEGVLLLSNKLINKQLLE